MLLGDWLELLRSLTAAIRVKPRPRRRARRHGYYVEGLESRIMLSATPAEMLILSGESGNSDPESGSDPLADAQAAADQAAADYAAPSPRLTRMRPRF